MIRKSLLDTSPEFEIHPWAGGIQLRIPAKLTESDRICSPRKTPTIQEVLQLPISVYFLNFCSELQNANDLIPQVLEVSLVKLLGRSIVETMPENNSYQEILNDRTVLESGQQCFFQETAIQKDGSCLNFLTVKLPWYTAENKIIGLLGFSMEINAHNPAQSLNLLRSWGLLNNNKPTSLDMLNLKIMHGNITYREFMVIEQLLLGRSARYIGETLNISKRTVETHIENIKNKLGVHTKSELIEKIMWLFNKSLLL